MSHVIVIKPGLQERNYWRDLWRYRELFYVLAWRDMAVRYKQTVIGVAWALIRPFLTMVVFTVIFGRIAKLPVRWRRALPADGVCRNAAVDLLLERAQRRIQQPDQQCQPDQQGLFPAADHPDGDGRRGLCRFSHRLLILLGMMAWYRFAPGWQIAVLPVFIVLASSPASGPRLWITALNVKYRDFRYIIPFIVQFGLYVSPVGFQLQRRAGAMAAALFAQSDGGGDRWLSLVPARRPKPALLCRASLLSVIVAAFFLWFGIRRFRATEKKLCRPDLTAIATPHVRHPIISVEHLSKRYLVGHRRRDRVTRIRSARRHWRAKLHNVARKAVDLVRGRQIVQGDEVEEFWALKDVSFEVTAGRGHRHHRPQRRRQEHAAQDPEPHHRADRGTSHAARPGREPARGRHRLSSRADRPREHLSQRRHPRHDAAPRFAASSTRSSRLPRWRDFWIRR